MIIVVPIPKLQVDFYITLGELRKTHLQGALGLAVKKLEVSKIDSELNQFVPSESLNKMAVSGLRGELLFPVPCILEQNPHLLCYYRLLYGFSQKEFYVSKNKLSNFKSMETTGKLTLGNKKLLGKLCESLSVAADYLLHRMDVADSGRELFDDLTLLTLGPQLRGGANVRKGEEGIIEVFSIIKSIMKKSIVEESPSCIKIKNAAGREVRIQFAPDPDIVIYEVMDDENIRNMIAIEIKAGTDFSNIHNRIGEAEKSHQKARISGYVECWTVINVQNFDPLIAKRESPSSDRFYAIHKIKDSTSDEYKDFKSRLTSLVGLKKNF